MSIYVPIRMASLKTSAEWNIQPEYTAAPLCCWFIRYTELILMQPAVHTVFMKVTVTVSFCWGVSCISSYLIHVNGVDTLHLCACVYACACFSVTMWSQYQPFYLWTVSLCVFSQEQGLSRCSCIAAQSYIVAPGLGCTAGSTRWRERFIISVIQEENAWLYSHLNDCSPPPSAAFL